MSLVPDCIAGIKSLKKRDLEEYVFTTPSKWDVNDAGFRRLVEKGSLYVFKRDSADFVTCVQGFGLMEILLTKKWRKFKSCSTYVASILFRDMHYCSASLFWEQII